MAKRNLCTKQPTLLWACLTVIGLCLATSVAYAFKAPKLTGHVNDFAKVLKPAEAARIEQRLQSYEARTGHQFAVAIVHTTGDESIENYAALLEEAWRLGDAKRDDAVLLVLAMKDRRMRIEVGYGLEGAIPDVVAARVINTILVPSFRTRAYADGIERAFDVLSAAAENDATGIALTPSATPERRLPRTARDEDFLSKENLPVVVGLGLFWVLFLWFIGRSFAAAIDDCRVGGFFRWSRPRRRREWWEPRPLERLLDALSSSGDRSESNCNSSDSSSTYTGGGGRSGGGGASGSW